MILRILFVCHGNICRSPMAEFIFRDMAEKEGLDVYVRSVALSSEELGNPVYPPARRKLNSLGLSCKGKVAEHIVKNDYREYNYIIGMESSHVSRLLRFFGGDPDEKIFRFLDLTPNPRNIADPWYTDDFDTCCSDIQEGCRYLIKFLKEKL